LSQNLDYRVLSTLISWVKNEWKFSRVLFNANSEDKRQVELMKDLELKESYSFPNDEKKVSFLLFEYS